MAVYRVPADVKVGDTVTINGLAYRVEDIDTDPEIIGDEWYAGLAMRRGDGPVCHYAFMDREGRIDGLPFRSGRF